MKHGKKVNYIDLTQTWESNLAMLLAIYEHGSSIARQFALEELRRMATLADKYVASQK